MPKMENIAGMQFGRWAVIEFSHRRGGRYFWDCVCACGTKRFVDATSLKRKLSVSCGCYRIEVITSDGKASARSIYRSYKKRAVNKNLEFDLSFEQFYELSQKSCVYCGVLPKQKHKGVSNIDTFIYNGIDRRDNSLGYTFENSYPCCGKCNTAKMAMTHDEYIHHCKLVASKWS